MNKKFLYPIVTFVILVSLLCIFYIRNFYKIETMLTGQPSRKYEKNLQKLNCIETDEHIIIVNNFDFLVKYKETQSQIIECEWNLTNYDYLITNDWPHYYMNIQGKYLFLDSGTAPGTREIHIYDLTKRKEVFEDFYQSDQSVTPEITNDKVTYWILSEITPELQNCPLIEEWKKDGFNARIFKKVELDLNTFKKTDLKDYKCFPEQ